MPAKFSGLFDRLGHARDGDRGGVRRQDRVGRQDRSAARDTACVFTSSFSTTASMTTSRSAMSARFCVVLSRPSASSISAGVMRPMSMRLCITLVMAADALFQGRWRRVEHDGAECRGGYAPRRCRSHDAGADDADPLDRPRLHRLASATPGSFCKPLRHEKDGDQVARDRAADQRHERSVSTLSPSSSGRLQPLAIASSAAIGAGNCPLVLARTMARGRRRT